ncbi:MAG: hypothetical protein M1136_03540 [Chloroflexi bacterium]|nr:hypothetical protein [Chloroflexota bacterium]MCL5074713.1 hypothetical protein [Chloroflexota bacterium]
MARLRENERRGTAGRVPTRIRSNNFSAASSRRSCGTSLPSNALRKLSVVILNERPASIQLLGVHLRRITLTGIWLASRSDESPLR